MQIVPGDIVLIKNIVFNSGIKDHAENGRPCMAFFVDKEEEQVHYLMLSSRLENVVMFNNYIVCDSGEKTGVISLDYVYQADYENVIAVVDNVGKDFFRIMQNFVQKYGENSDNCYYIDYCLERSEFYFEHQEVIEKILRERKKMFKIKEKNHQIMHNNYVEEDPIAKKLIRKKQNQYRMKKEKMNNVDMSY